MNYCEKYKNIMIDRKGDVPDSNMTTLDVTNIVKPGVFYKITSDSLLKTRFKFTNYPINSNITKDDINHIEIKNNWNWNSNMCTSKSNILGDSGILTIDSKDLDNNIKLTIPIADIENLEFYGCTLYGHGDMIGFDIDSELPVAIVEIGKNYIDHYIMKKAGGVYLEIHDRPHFHMPLNKEAGGYLVIGKYHNENILLSAFNIPYGYGVKMSNNVIHNDCFLTGNYLVVYSKTEDYSTVLLKNNKNKEIQVNIN